MDFGEELKNELVKAARGAFQSLFANGERWVLANPEPIELGKVNYKR